MSDFNSRVIGELRGQLEEAVRLVWAWANEQVEEDPPTTKAEEALLRWVLSRKPENAKGYLLRMMDALAAPSPETGTAAVPTFDPCRGECERGTCVTCWPAPEPVKPPATCEHGPKLHHDGGCHAHVEAPELPGGWDYCPCNESTGVRCGRTPTAVTAEPVKPTATCPDCKGRGWNVGECHPRETCGACDGTGRTPAAGTAPTLGLTEQQEAIIAAAAVLSLPVTPRRSPAVVTHAPPGETYPEFTTRVAEDCRRVKAKCDALDRFIPRCTSCGETCEPIEAGAHCKENGMPMISRWAQEKSGKEFYRLGHFARGGWSTSEIALAELLDRVRAGEETT